VLPISVTTSSSAHATAAGGTQGGSGGVFGDMNVQYGGIGGATSAGSSMLKWIALAAAAALVVPWLRTKL
jgi:hypothetical protein